MPIKQNINTKFNILKEVKTKLDLKRLFYYSGGGVLVYDLTIKSELYIESRLEIIMAPLSPNVI